MFRNPTNPVGLSQDDDSARKGNAIGLKKAEERRDWAGIVREAKVKLKRTV
jgi:hypothetical protein